MMLLLVTWVSEGGRVLVDISVPKMEDIWVDSKKYGKIDYSGAISKTPSLLNTSEACSL